MRSASAALAALALIALGASVVRAAAVPPSHRAAKPATPAKRAVV